MSTALESLEPDVLVDVVLDSATEPLVTSVRQVDGTTLLLEAPVDRSGRLVLPPSNERGLLVWRDADLVQAPLSVVGTRGWPAPQWRVEVVGRPSPCQRRSFVRADVEVPAVLRTGTGRGGGGGAYDVRVDDVSEGGLRCTARAPGRLQLGDRLTVEVDLAGTSWELPVDVVRLRLPPTGGVDLGLRFSDLALADADRIRSFVFAEQRRRRARGGL